MFYRYTKAGGRIAVDLEGLCAGQTLFLLGGSPTLKEMPLDLLRRPGIATMAVNNVPFVFPKPTFWVCADKPECFSPHVFADPSIMKFTMISRRFLKVPILEKNVCQCPNMLFFGTKEDFKLETFLRQDRDLAWWKSVFPIALQLAWRLGFRRVYLVGCGFNMPAQVGGQYAWATKLTNYQRNYSQRTYNADLDRLRKLQPVFKKHGFEVISCTPGSAANEFLRTSSLEMAVLEAQASLPKPADSMALKHSSELSAIQRQAGEKP